MTDESLESGRNTLLPLFLLSAGVILWEILLTRIFSVILFYHYAFMSISVAMFGLTLGALAVLGAGSRLTGDRLEGVLGRLALATGSAMAVCLVVQLSIPLRFHGASAPSGYLALTYLLSSLPFVPAGAFICIALTRLRPVGVLYGCDLMGAAVGCGLVPLLTRLFGGPGAILATAALVCTAGYLELRRSARRLAVTALAATFVLLALAALNLEIPLVRVRWRHDGPVRPALHVSWNAFSRVAVSRYPSTEPFGWGIEQELRAKARHVEQLYLEIDSGAATPITRFEGDLEAIEFLRLDITSFAHNLRHDADVLVIGSGGGRDVLSALLFEQRSVRAVDVNRDIIRAVNEVFGDFSGHLDELPQVEFVAQEGRSHLARSERRFDIIQASLVDTVAATAAGAYAFTESGLYTVEAWQLFLSRLKPGGLLTVSRWWFGVTTWPVEVGRLVALGSAALRSQGIEDPRRHMLLVRTWSAADPAHGEGLATLLLSPDPLTDEDLEQARLVCEQIRCVVSMSWQEAEHPMFERLVGHTSNAELDALFPLDVTPPTDNRPYFFFHDRLGDVLRGQRTQAHGASAFNTSAVRLLVTLAGLTLVLGLGLVLLPPLVLRVARRWPPAPRAARLAPLYFAGIGLGFMFVEVGFMQQLSIFLGHPVYGFTVALLGFLLAGGLGSLASARLSAAAGAGRSWLALLLIAPSVLVCSGAAPALARFAGAATPVRVLLALAVIGPPAFLMGLGFPVAMELVRRLRDGRAAWYWAINGAASVVASVLAMVLCLSLGIRETIALGAAVYLLTALVFRGMEGRESARS